MSEPTQVEDRASQRRGPSTNAPSPSNGELAKPGGLRSKLRAATYSEGEQLLQPEAPVQLKPDPDGKRAKPRSTVDELEGKVDELEEKNAGLEKEIGGLRAKNDKQERDLDATKADLEVTNANLVKGWEQDVDLGVQDVRAHLRDANAGTTGLEELVERTLAGDDRQRAANKGVAGAIETHNDAQKLSPIGALNMLLDVANVVKSGITLAKALGKKLAEEGGKAGALGAGVDFVTNGMGTTKDGKDIQDKSRDASQGDTTVGMIKAVDSKVDAIGDNVEALQKYAFGTEISKVHSALDAASRARNRVKAAADNLGTNLSPKLDTLVTGASKALVSSGEDMVSRLERTQQLLKARDPKEGGGGELGQGTTGRTIFDIVAKRRDGCELHAETLLKVEASRQDDFTTSTERTGFWLSVNDPELRDELAVPLFAHRVQPMRPNGIGREATYLPVEIGRPLSTLVATSELPYERVRLTGNVRKEWATRAEWEDTEQRERLLTRPNLTPLASDHG